MSIALISLGPMSIAVHATPPEGMLPQGLLHQELLPQGSLPQGSLLLGSLPQGTLPLGSLPQGSVPQGLLADDPPVACEYAGAAAEQAGGLPSGLLLAIGRVESGKWDQARGRVAPWPWTINAAGKGRWFGTKAMAAGAARALLDGGIRSIDVGCFQINLLYHPSAFADLEQAFDPEANARYAVRFLLSLFSRTGSWEAAVEAYHSADPALGFAYRQQVFSSWTSALPPANGTVTSATRVVSAARSPSRPLAMPVVMAGVQVWTPMPGGSGATIVAMPPPGGALTDLSPSGPSASGAFPSGESPSGESPSGMPPSGATASGMYPPQETQTRGSMPPLPVVSYWVMPRR